MSFDPSNPSHVTTMINEAVSALQALEGSRAASDRFMKIVARNGIDFSSISDFPTSFVITPAQMDAANAVLDALYTIYDTNITPSVQNSIDDILLNIGKLSGTG